MAGPLRKVLLPIALVLVTAQGIDTAAQPPADKAPLTQRQIKKYLRSYLPAHEVVSRYWGKRQYTTPDKILPPEGTFERAIEEMRAADTLPAFERLLQSYGFDRFDAWQALGQRISFAYGLMREGKLDPASVVLQRQAWKSQLAMIAEERAKLQSRNAPESLGQLKGLDAIKRQIEREIQADADAEILRPYIKQFEELTAQVRTPQR